jgi:cytochrome c553
LYGQSGWRGSYSLAQVWYSSKKGAEMSVRKGLKWIGIVFGSLVGLLVLALGVVYLLGEAKLNKKYELSVESITVSTDAQAVQRGEHLATAILLCTRCHGENLAGQVYFDEPGLLTIPSPNLTAGKGGIGQTYTDEDWLRAIRHGVGKDGHGLFFMPAPAFQVYSEQDTAALLAYLKQLPPVDNELPTRSFELIAKVMTGVGAIPPMPVDLVDHAAPFGAVVNGLTPDYGSVLAGTCKECHGEKLNGTPFGPPGQEVMTPNLTPGGELAAWNEADFTKTMRTGVTPAGRPLNGEMPWKYYGKMTDDELKAIWLYLQSLPSLKTGE